MENENDECNQTEDGAAASGGVPHLISNLAVLELLQPRVKIRKGRKSSNRKLQHRDWIERHVVDYLQGSACTQFVNASNAASLQRVLRSNKKQVTTNGAVSSGFDLTDAESLQILNLSPTEPVEIHLLIDELQDRMTTERQDDLLSTIQSYHTIKSETNGAQHSVSSTTMNGQHDKRPAASKKG